jgi:hypothetical protein
MTQCRRREPTRAVIPESVLIRRGQVEDETQVAWSLRLALGGHTGASIGCLLSGVERA